MNLRWGKYLFIIMLATNHCLYSLNSDKQKSILFKSDKATINQSNHIGTYIGHVELTQGSTHIRASKMVTHLNEKNKLKDAYIFGHNKKQAHIWTTLDNKKIIHAYADKMIYDPIKNVIFLIGNAKVIQNGSSFKAPHIEYDLLKKQVITQPVKHQRTEIVIPEESIHE